VTRHDLAGSRGDSAASRVGFDGGRAASRPGPVQSGAGGNRALKHRAILAGVI
jgi:hypothetical protein